MGQCLECQENSVLSVFDQGMLRRPLGRPYPAPKVRHAKMAFAAAHSFTSILGFDRGT